MEDKEKSPLRIRYEYEQEGSPKVRYAHGVWGGINPLGEVELNFYTESDKMPAYSERIITPEGAFGPEISPGEENLKIISRSVHSRVLLNYQTARAVLEWLEDKVAELEAEEHDERLYFEGVSGKEQ